MRSSGSVLIEVLGGGPPVSFRQPHVPSCVQRRLLWHVGPLGLTRTLGPLMCLYTKINTHTKAWPVGILGVLCPFSYNILTQKIGLLRASCICQQLCSLVCLWASLFDLVLELAVSQLVVFLFCLLVSLLFSVSKFWSIFVHEHFFHFCLFAFHCVLVACIVGHYFCSSLLFN